MNLLIADRARLDLLADRRFECELSPPSRVSRPGPEQVKGRGGCADQSVAGLGLHAGGVFADRTRAPG